MEDSSASPHGPLEHPKSSLFDRELNYKIRTVLTVIQGSAELLESHSLRMSQEERQALFSDIYEAVAQILDALPEHPEQGTADSET